MRRAGGFPLGEKNDISTLQALALAEGLDKDAIPQRAKIFRVSGQGGQRIEIPVNLKTLLAGRGPDIPMQPDDILFVPNSASRAAGYGLWKLFSRPAWVRLFTALNDMEFPPHHSFRRREPDAGAPSRH